MRRTLAATVALFMLLATAAPAFAVYVELWTKRSVDPADAAYFDLGDSGIGDNAMPLHAHSSEGAWSGSLAHFTRVLLWPGLPSTHFTGPFFPPAGTPPPHTVYGDTDGDGTMEFVSCTTSGILFRLAVWDGMTGALETNITFPPDASTVQWIHLLDMNGDGTSEILVHWLGVPPGLWGTTAWGWTTPNNVETPAAPQGSLLRQNAPNPFDGATGIRYALARASDVRVQVFDAQGREVRTLSDGHRPAGEHEIRWDGRDNEGNALASGVYYYELTAAGERQTRKAVKLQ